MVEQSHLDQQKSSSLHPPRWRYAVQATLLNHKAYERYLDWLFSGHVEQVCQWAECAEVVSLEADEESDGEARHVLSVYWFADREAFEQYEKEGAPVLRAEGVALASTLGGISFKREVGWAWPIRRRSE